MDPGLGSEAGERGLSLCRVLIGWDLKKSGLEKKKREQSPTVSIQAWEMYQFVTNSKGLEQEQQEPSSENALVFIHHQLPFLGSQRIRVKGPEF